MSDKIKNTPPKKPAILPQKDSDPNQKLNVRPKPILPPKKKNPFRLMVDDSAIDDNSRIFITRQKITGFSLFRFWPDFISFFKNLLIVF